MCGPITRKTIFDMPEEQLSKLISREMDVTINPKVLRMFIRAHWSKVTSLAHTIHEAG